MIREQKAPSRPRPDFSPSRTYANFQMTTVLPMAHTDSIRRQENYDSTPRPPRVVSREPTLNASSRNNHSLFSFGGYNNTDEKSTTSYEFLPSPSFDDLQSSINAASKDFSSDLPPTEGTNTILVGGKHPVEAMEASNEGRGTAGARVVSGPRPARAGSILRRQSTSTRKSSISSTTSAASGAMDPPSAPPTARNRRQSQYPPISGGGSIIGSKAPRKSIGPGGIDPDYSRQTQRRRPSLASSTSNQGLSDNGGVSTRVNIGGTPTYTDGARGLTASRAAKTKSLQPPSRQGQTHLAPNASTPDHSRSSSFAGRSPGRQNGKGPNTPLSSSKRMSVMPGMAQGNHATGLGARTISPTDARRAKRLSILQQPPPMPHTPPTAQLDVSVRHSSRSPSMLPRKIATPSSSRTTPDINRKSYSSGISTGSNASYNTMRTSTGSLQPRLSQQPPTSSRLPTPKPRNVHSSADNNEEEEVPPVPAIPKAYESPKDSPTDPPFFTKRKSSMPFDASSINSISTNSLSGRNSIREHAKSEREHKPRQYGTAASNSDDQQNNATPVKKKNLQPLRLPPLNLLPLSNPTAAKIDAMSRDAASSDGHITPPARRSNTKTPSTPMTASKASFFSRSRADEKADSNLRSSTSVHHLRSGSSSQIVGSSSESLKPIAMSTRAPRQTVSPFVSSSLPKTGGEHLLMSRSKTSSDFTTADSGSESRPARLTGPRAQKLTKAPKTETTSQISSPEEPTTPSSGSSLRRKLSLSWKRSTSKSNINVSHAANERGSEYGPPPPKHDNMPPPKLPASATLNNLSSYSVPSPSPSVKSTTYLDSKRRKSSVSSLSLLNGHDRTRSDSWGINGSPKKEQPVENKAERPLPRSTSSTVFKNLKPKASSSNMKATDPWTVDLDRDDQLAEEEMKKLGSRRKETETAAKTLDGLRKRARPKDRMSPAQALHSSYTKLNIFEKGEIVDFPDIYFCGLDDAKKHVGELSADTVNFGYDDERGDYGIVPGDHLLYRYEIVDVLGKGSFGQVVRCIDHKTGTLVAVKIIRNKKRFHQQALVEVNILKKLREWVSRSARPKHVFFTSHHDIKQSRA
jgi:dual specificity tyrosine-phosphorylation-regulated kinase 2/3/4